MDRLVEWKKGFPVAYSPVAASSVRERVHLMVRVVILLTATSWFLAGDIPLRWIYWWNSSKDFQWPFCRYPSAYLFLIVEVFHDLAVIWNHLEEGILRGYFGFEQA